jgi:hypothetical protein
MKAFLAAMLALSLATSALAVDSGPLEYHLRNLKARIYRMSPRSFQTLYPDGAVHERFTVTSSGYSYALFDSDGTRIVSWTRKKSGQVTYESWYTARLPKERLLEDDRSISYTSFYKNGQKWEQYIYNKQKHVKSYDVYDKWGRLLRAP